MMTPTEKRARVVDLARQSYRVLLAWFPDSPWREREIDPSGAFGTAAFAFANVFSATAGNAERITSLQSLAVLCHNHDIGWDEIDGSALPADGR